MKEVIVKPSHSRKPDFIMGFDNVEYYTFECLSCSEKMQIYINAQILDNITGKGENLSEQEYLDLKEYYNIGISNKSREGGFPVFDKVSCEKCQTAYYTYLGIDEPRNAVFHVQIQGVIKKW